MLRVTCDGCGKELRPGEDRSKDHYVVKIEVFAVRDPSELTEDDFDADHMEAVSELLQQLDGTEDPLDLEPAAKHLRYDLCGECRKRYLRDPLGREASTKFQFSKN